MSSSASQPVPGRSAVASSSSSSASVGPESLIPKTSQEIREKLRELRQRISSLDIEIEAHKKASNDGRKGPKKHDNPHILSMNSAIALKADVTKLYGSLVPLLIQA